MVIESWSAQKEQHHAFASTQDPPGLKHYNNYKGKVIYSVSTYFIRITLGQDSLGTSLRFYNNFDQKSI